MRRDAVAGVGEDAGRCPVNKITLRGVGYELAFALRPSSLAATRRPRTSSGPLFVLQGYIRPTQQKPSCLRPCVARRC
jgi:hypothetical protein